MTTVKASRLSEAIAEMAEDQRRLGLLDDAAFQKLTLRRLGRESLPGDEPITGNPGADTGSVKVINAAINEAALKDLIRAAVTLNTSRTRR